ncbi:MAG: pyridoxamine 5'-phosphate oxidase family protein, partial [Promethearchaeota archaeon]
MQIEEIYEFLDATDTVYLSTIDKDKKEPRVRVMGLISYNKQYWLTSKSSRNKMEQIRANNRFEFCTLIRQGTNIGTIRA